MNPALQFVDGQRIRCKIRHQPEFTFGTIRLTERGADIISEVAISGVTPGQFGVVYYEVEPYVIGSGVIVESSEFRV